MHAKAYVRRGFAAPQTLLSCKTITLGLPYDFADALALAARDLNVT
jgi:hypothetical protein